ncbi:E3 ubiquitin-protein ligase [Wickerhamomyces ciferrii]|uniref:E3 ubiquitin-protein ligase n=1 Tax=Wickerhamomyces ciferrii (strain ATCC 14091 / BCRC 22168 / CBS 111 / JCM 3599 / NBRC 0793 / NRRL Y-1031 F-60-10) TaxID=1206466 RepID=K0KKZ5_WICCF|nr:E3 ubiquitin-protein ligase [Wickerhamomyces ciferrii]CCH45900.1 E3 ubiquitin-protein ligase [Wickerhamomyces ciferrii]
MKLFKSPRLNSCLILSICLLLQISNTSPVPQGHVSGFSNPDEVQVNYPDELSTDHNITEIMDINKSNTSEAHGDDEYSLFKSGSNNDKTEIELEADNSEKEHKNEFDLVHLCWIIPIGLLFMIGSLGLLCGNYTSVYLIYHLIVGTYKLLRLNEDEYPPIQEPETELPVSNDRDPNSNVVTRSQIDSHIYDQNKLEEVSKSSIIPPHDSYKLITTDQLETPEYEEWRNQDVCLICLESFNEIRDHLAQLPCAHTFHYSCFIKTGSINGDSNNVLGSPNMRCCACQLSLIKYHQYLADYKLDHKQVEFVNK